MGITVKLSMGIIKSNLTLPFRARAYDVFYSKPMSKYMQMKSSPRGSFIVVIFSSKFFAEIF